MVSFIFWLYLTNSKNYAIIIFMKIHTGTDITAQPGEIVEDQCTPEEKQRLLDAPPNMSSLDDEPWWVTAIGMLLLAAAFLALFILL